MSPTTHELTFDGSFLQRGFWLYAWEVTAPSGEVVYYVGRTGDSSSQNAQSPFNRMGQHLGFAQNSCMLRRHLQTGGLAVEECHFRLVSHGPIFPEADNRDDHVTRRDVIAAMEKELANRLVAAKRQVMNTVRCHRPLDSDAFEPIWMAFEKSLRADPAGPASRPRGERLN